MIDKYREKTREEALEDLYIACLDFRHSKFWDECIRLETRLSLESHNKISLIISRTRDIEEQTSGRKLWKQVQE